MTAPVPTQLGAVQRYIAPSIRRVIWVPTIANPAAPTKAEISAGTELTTQVPPDGIGGFTVSADTVDAPDLSSRFTSKVPGMISADDSSLTIYTSTTSTDARQLLTRNLTGFVVIAPEGMATPASNKISVFPVQITASSVQYGSGADMATLMVSFAITATPIENIAVPTT